MVCSTVLSAGHGSTIRGTIRGLYAETSKTRFPSVLHCIYKPFAWFWLCGLVVCASIWNYLELSQASNQNIHHLRTIHPSNQLQPTNIPNGPLARSGPIRPNNYTRTIRGVSLENMTLITEWSYPQKAYPFVYHSRLTPILLYATLV